ncbi:MAG: hypothetical protein HC794_09305 [Nitrospiraceae bacterium]|nr:hypothetical protein [Nitrospiraceae bacterium]
MHKIDLLERMLSNSNVASNAACTASTLGSASSVSLTSRIRTLSLERRIRSREAAPFADKMLAIMRNAFGGHAFLREEKTDK